MKNSKASLFVGLYFVTVLAASPARADEVKVDITSFVAAGSRTRAAELCGKVTGAKTFPTFIRVVVDEKTNRPGVYNVTVGSDGSFCTTVVSYAGTAVASVWSVSGSEYSSEQATLELQGSRK